VGSSKFINQEIYMQYSVNMNHNGIAAHLTRGDHEGSNVVDRTYMLWNGNEQDRDVRSECEEDEGTECENG
jgi:hypothetical protein